MPHSSKRHSHYAGQSQSSGTEPSHSQHHKQKKKPVTFGPYYVGSTLGEGEFGKVRLGWTKVAQHGDGPVSSYLPKEVPKQVAIKLIRRDTIKKSSDKEVKIYREINALKHLTHPNIVKLEEVLQNSKYIGIVLEYASGGEFYKYIQKKKRLKEALAGKLFAQLISGVSYMHYKGLVHRDLKLENLLLDNNENLVITDFGFVNEFSSGNELMSTSCGSPCYAAPELVVSTKPYEGRIADIWSCGIILYAMLAGYLPWDDDPTNPEGDDIAKLYLYIIKSPLKFPEYVSPISRDLLRKILVSDPKNRIGVKQITQHLWLKPHNLFLSITPEEWDNNDGKDYNDIRFPQKTAAIRANSMGAYPYTNASANKRNSLMIDSTFSSSFAAPHNSQTNISSTPIQFRDSNAAFNNKHISHNRKKSAASEALHAVIKFDKRSSSSPIPSVVAQTVSTVHNLHSETDDLSQQKDKLDQRKLQLDTDIKSGAVQPNSKEMLILESPNTEILREIHGIYGNKQIDVKKLENPEKNKNLFPKHMKPRPTSYHPGSTSKEIMSATELGTNVKYNEKPSNRQNSSLATVHQEQTLNVENTPKHYKQTSSPRLGPNNSFSMSNPSLDLREISAEMSKFDDKNLSAAKSMQAEVEKHNKNQLTIDQDDTNKDIHQQRNISGKSSPSKVLKDFKKLELEDAKKKQQGNAVTENVLKLPSTTNERTTHEKKHGKKRFSILSFYSLYNSSKASVNSTDSKVASSTVDSQKYHNRNSSAVNDSPTRKGNTSRTSSFAVADIFVRASPAIAPLPEETIKDTNNDHKHRHTKSSHKKKNRASVMVSDLPQEESKTAERHKRHPSTAKKIVDFFKRRSMRL